MVALSLEEQERANLFPGDANATAAASNASHVDYDRQLALKLQEEEEQLAAQENRATASPSSSHGSQRNAPDSGPSASGQRNSGKKDKVTDAADVSFPSLGRGAPGSSRAAEGRGFAPRAAVRWSSNANDGIRRGGFGHGGPVRPGRGRPP